MLNLITEKRSNGRATLILLLEPQDVDHIRKCEVVTADSSKVETYDILISYVPDGVRFKNMVSQELPTISAQRFKQLMQIIQGYPEVRRPVQAGGITLNRQDADTRKI